VSTSAPSRDRRHGGGLGAVSLLLYRRSWTFGPGDARTLLDLLDLRRPAPVRPEAAQWSLIAVTFRRTIGETGGFA
jgi:hypothetical protein